MKGVFERYLEFERLPDLDVSKVAKCAVLSETLGTALDTESMSAG